MYLSTLLGETWMGQLVLWELTNFSFSEDCLFTPMPVCDSSCRPLSSPQHWGNVRNTGQDNGLQI